MGRSNGKGSVGDRSVIWNRPELLCRSGERRLQSDRGSTPARSADISLHAMRSTEKTSSMTFEQWPWNLTSLLKETCCLHWPELSEEAWNSTMRTNLTGTWLVAKYVGRYMCDAKHKHEHKHGGSIINISSISGLPRGELPGGLAYVSSKAGVVTLTKV
ncbi:unnamed protein product [Lactuca virosa]|uniref:Uncharacterized protein n=1 Tax=Lactuca virosa TaxID=75947 RepID=A0AAU9MRX8_9ASTR|nr:unnamed protein product [Lactuca virosa]